MLGANLSSGCSQPCTFASVSPGSLHSGRACLKTPNASIGEVIRGLIVDDASFFDTTTSIHVLRTNERDRLHYRTRRLMPVTRVRGVAGRFQHRPGCSRS